jgi:CspA family cold shock protein
MEKGTVKFYKNDSGYGFIINDNDGKEIFVHATGLIDKIKENDRVTYDVTEGKKGLNAVNVTLI